MSELRRLRELKDENHRLNELVADLTLDKHMLSEAWRKSLRPVRRRELAGWFQVTFQVMACGPVPGPTERRAMDFLHDALAGGCPFRILTVVDRWSRQSP